tara:strand:- start:3741 stop:4937 length:1197 start_codon:yes stop_codon:yes gene_type:complete
MRFAITGELLGTKSHLIFDDDQCGWYDSIPNDTWTCGDPESAMDLVTVASAIGERFDLFGSHEQDRAWSQIRKQGSKKIPWSYVLPPEMLKDKIEKIKESASNLIMGVDGSYYCNEFIDNRRFLLGLHRPKINEKALNSALSHEDNPSNYQSLLRLKPDSQGFSRAIKYSQTSSVTGRLTVTEGPNILTLKRDHRSVFRSRFKGGSLIQIDLVSLEPRIALVIANKKAPYDIYSNVRDKVLNGEVTRDIAKISTICCLYGISSRRLGSKLPPTLNPRHILSEVRAHFDIPYLESSLRQQAAKSGHIANFYGRLIKSESSHVNHFLQSTGVDVSLLGFKKIVKDCDDHGVDAIPVFVIHDALILDVRQGHERKIKKLLKEGIDIPGMTQKFPVKIEKFV